MIQYGPRSKKCSLLSWGGDQHVTNLEMKMQSPLQAPTSKGTTFQLSRTGENSDELAC